MVRGGHSRGVKVSAAPLKNDETISQPDASFNLRSVDDFPSLCGQAPKHPTERRVSSWSQIAKPSSEEGSQRSQRSLDTASSASSTSTPVEYVTFVDLPPIKIPVAKPDPPTTSGSLEPELLSDMMKSESGTNGERKTKTDGNTEEPPRDTPKQTGNSAVNGVSPTEGVLVTNKTKLVPSPQPCISPKKRGSRSPKSPPSNKSSPTRPVSPNLHTKARAQCRAGRTAVSPEKRTGRTARTPSPAKHTTMSPHSGSPKKTITPSPATSSTQRTRVTAATVQDVFRSPKKQATRPRFLVLTEVTNKEAPGPQPSKPHSAATLSNLQARQGFRATATNKHDSSPRQENKHVLKTAATTKWLPVLPLPDPIEDVPFMAAEAPEDSPVTTEEDSDDESDVSSEVPFQGLDDDDDRRLKAERRALSRQFAKAHERGIGELGYRESSSSGSPRVGSSSEPVYSVPSVPYNSPEGDGEGYIGDSGDRNSMSISRNSPRSVLNPQAVSFRPQPTASKGTPDQLNATGPIHGNRPFDAEIFRPPIEWSGFGTVLARVSRDGWRFLLCVNLSLQYVWHTTSPDGTTSVTIYQ